MTDILRTKAMLNFGLSLIPKGGKKCTFYLSSFESGHLHQKDSLTSEKSKAKYRA